MKRTYLLLLIACSAIAIYAQKVPVSLTGNFRTNVKDWGIGAQVMIPVYKNLYVAPSITYFFEKEYEFNTTMIKSNTSTKTLNYGIDAHYALHINNTKSFVSPFLGIEGMTAWSNTSGSSLGIYQGSIVPEHKWSSFGGDWTGFSLLGNLGVAGKWFVDGDFFFTTQARYSIVFEDMDSNHFVFTGGIGYAF